MLVNKNEYSSYLKDSLIKNDVKTITNGRSEILQNGDLFIEETIYGRSLYFNSNGSLRWTHVNRADDGNVYMVGWSRILYTNKDVQTVNAHIGQSTNRFEKVTITNPNILFSKNLYLDNLEINQDPDILNSIVNMTVSSVLDVTNLSINNNSLIKDNATCTPPPFVRFEALINIFIYFLCDFSNFNLHSNEL